MDGLTPGITVLTARTLIKIQFPIAIIMLTDNANFHSQCNIT